MKTVFIYALNEPCSGPDPTAGRTRYIGKAADPYLRYEQHLNDLKRDRTYKGNWIRSLLAVGKTPILEILDEVPEAEWQFWEREWIRLFWALGFRLTNCTDGGEGSSNPPEEIRVKMREAHTGEKNHFFGKHHSEESRKKIGDRTSERIFSEEGREKIRLTHLGKPKSSEHKAKIGEASRGRVPSAEQREKQSAAMKGRPSPLKGTKRSAEFCANVSAAMMGVKQSLETRAKRAEAMKLWWIKKKGLVL